MSVVRSIEGSESWVRDGEERQRMAWAGGTVLRRGRKYVSLFKMVVPRAFCGNLCRAGCEVHLMDDLTENWGGCLLWSPERLCATPWDEEQGRWQCRKEGARQDKKGAAASAEPWLCWEGVGWRGGCRVLPALGAASSSKGLCGTCWLARAMFLLPGWFPQQWTGDFGKGVVYSELIVCFHWPLKSVIHSESSCILTPLVLGGFENIICLWLLGGIVRMH